MMQPPSSSQSQPPGSLSDSYPALSPTSLLDDQVEPGQHALVIGSGIAGMTAAKVLSKHFQRVTVLERDQLPEQPKFRAGKPQGRHAHVLLGRGLLQMEEIFPGLTVFLRQHGAIKCKWGPDTRWYHFGGWRRQHPTAMTTITCSVNLIEWALRRQLQEAPQVRILTECTVDELLADGHRVVGLRVSQHRKGRGHKQCELRGALVVDATGRRSMAPEWLTKLGLGPIPETKVEAFWGYATRYYERPAQTGVNWRQLAIHPTPPDSKRLGVLLPLENNLWLATVAGTHGDYPPDDDAGFLEFAQGLAQPDLYEVIRHAKPVSGIYGYRYAENRLRHFEKLDRYLEGFVAVGDAVCQFNPIYGQGMTVASLGAARLDRCLRAHLKQHPDRELRGLAQKFQQGLARDLRVPWLITTCEDLRFVKPEVRAQQPLYLRAMQVFVRRVLELAANDFLAFRLFISVMHLVGSPLRLMHPGLLLKLLWRALTVPRPAPTAIPWQPRTLPPAKLSPRLTSGEVPMCGGDLSNSSSGLRSINPNQAPSSLSGPMAASAATPSRLWRDRSLRK
jgi:2-polyprenyl-6-methoxyphenol hydroxylase-like FAD-dependent oxidoreductase